MSNTQILKTTSKSRYTAYHSNGTIIASNMASPFMAIGKATTIGDYVKELDTGAEIFRRSNSTCFYKFQFTNYYGSTTNESEAKNWAYNFKYSHIVNNKGEFCYHNYTALTGKGLTLFENNFEPNNGGYFYNYSYGDKKYLSASIECKLSEAKLRLSTTSRNNPYIFLSMIGTDAQVEYGIMIEQQSTSLPDSINIKVYYREIRWGNTNSDTNVQPIANVSVMKYKSSEYTTNDNITINLSLRDDGQPGYIGYLSINNKYVPSSYRSGILQNSSLKPGNDVTFLSAASFVPNTSVISDLRNGAYFKNIHLNSYIYPTTGQGSGGVKFSANSSATYRSFVYNDDTCTHNYSNNDDIVNIDYSKSYQS